MPLSGTPRIRKLHVNGREASLDAEPNRTLLSVLRNDLGLTGAKYGCGEGLCGACTVLVDEASVRACITPVKAVAGKRITTIEGLAQQDRLHPVQQAFLDTGAFQCGYCTPGMILSAVALLRENPTPGEAEIKDSLEGNICRCGAYLRIVAAVRLAATGKAAGQ
ncbi:MAG: (2Fe-2S)-binding protein [Bryobacteraceae bacterium]|nr:(2Fe-2S)-binding protein [Bryobacterales bacterium]MEB2363292.1 (2Fe-2S)-binding protein [Bryobacterales bacterium]NUN03161.1 (2Fe-2S)-binding protein [Bryobacteraceae bacterium]